MTHAYGHVECGGGGAVLGEKTIIIYDHEYLNVGNHLKQPELEAKLIADGKSPEKARKISEHMRERMHRDTEGWYAELEKLGIETHYHEPHPGNFTP